MTLADILSPEAVLPALKVKTKKQVLLELAERAARVSGLDVHEIEETLTRRERLGSTGVGAGIALPHGKLPSAKSLFGIFARLERPVPFDAIDGAPVDLVFLLIAPETAGADHLKALARIARLLRDSDVAGKLRLTREPTALYALLTQEPTPHAA